MTYSFLLFLSFKFTFPHSRLYSKLVDYSCWQGTFLIQLYFLFSCPIIKVKSFFFVFLVKRNTILTMLEIYMVFSPGMWWGESPHSPSVLGFSGHVTAVTAVRWATLAKRSSLGRPFSGCCLELRVEWSHCWMFLDFPLSLWNFKHLKVSSCLLLGFGNSDLLFLWLVWGIAYHMESGPYYYWDLSFCPAVKGGSWLRRSGGEPGCWTKEHSKFSGSCPEEKRGNCQGPGSSIVCQGLLETCNKFQRWCGRLTFLRETQHHQVGTM